MFSFRHAAAGILLAVFLQAARAQALKREHFQNADVLYDFVANSHGEKLRH